MILLINVQVTRSKLLGTHYTHSQAYFKTWMDIITLSFFAPEYHFITSLHVTLTRFLLKYIYQLIK